MKIYAIFPDLAKNVANTWTEQISDQVKETVDLLVEECNNDPRGWKESKEDKPLFPYFIQEDSHARFIFRHEDHNDRYYINNAYYTLLFQWEVVDFDEGDLFDYNEYYRDLIKEVGLDKEDDIRIPEGYVYLGTYFYQQAEPLSLPGLVFNNEDELAQDCVLADCMFTNKEEKNS